MGQFQIVAVVTEGIDSTPEERYLCIALDPCQWQWCEKTSGFGSNPILASSLD